MSGTSGSILPWFVAIRTLPFASRSHNGPHVDRQHKANKEQCETENVTIVGIMYIRNIHTSHRGTDLVTLLLPLPKLYHRPSITRPLKNHINDKQEAKTD